MKRTEAVPPERRILVRIGINVGEIIGDGSDIYGDDVNVAARLDAMAEPSGIYVSRAVRDPVRDKLCFSFEDLGEVARRTSRGRSMSPASAAIQRPRARNAPCHQQCRP